MADDHASAPVRQPFILTVPGLGNSGTGHWQTLWEAQRDDCQRVELGQWDQPHRNSSVNQLNLAIRAAVQASGAPVVLVAHSLGCLAVAWWAQLEADAGRLVAGALLVAPPDVEANSCDDRLAGFSPAPAAALPFPSIVVASTNDPYITASAARQLAQQWRASFADAGPIGHINAESGVSDWPFGQSLLQRLLTQLAPAGGGSAAASDQDDPARATPGRQASRAASKSWLSPPPAV